ncbi:MAG: imidazolonepropionase [Thermoplasmatota archaeon]
MLLIKDASEVFLLDGCISDASILIDDGRIQRIGSDCDASGADIIDATGKTVLPGFVDCHTHVVFAGSREFELDMKLKGASYQDIAEQGGGIGYTVRHTREASPEGLYMQARRRLDVMLRHGTTTMESKSGYGLDTETEIKILEVTRLLGSEHVVDIIPTFLGAHAVPSNMDKAEYIDLVIEDMLPRVAEQQLAVFCDVFCEEGYFTPDETRRILQAGIEHGLKPKIHADEFTDIGGAQLAAELGATSADHLLMASRAGIQAMAHAGVVPVLLPAVPFSMMQDRYADARAMLDVGLSVALATDLNPNCWTENMQLVIQLACFQMGMTPREAIEGATINAARAIGLHEHVGSIEVGKQADLLILDAPSHCFVPYHFGVNLVETVIKRGAVV